MHETVLERGSNNARKWKPDVPSNGRLVRVRVNNPQFSVQITQHTIRIYVGVCDSSKWEECASVVLKLNKAFRAPVRSGNCGSTYSNALVFEIGANPRNPLVKD